ncbi:MAG: ABC transporter permease [Hyphomicrobium sp.]
MSPARTKLGSLGKATASRRTKPLKDFRDVTDVASELPPLTAPAIESVGAASPSDGNQRLLVLEPGRAERNYWRDLWAYRELFAILAWRDLAVRYKQTVIGVAWAVIRPLLTMVIFTVIFGYVAKLPSAGGAPYPIMVYSAMLPWFLFSTILSEASNSLVANANLIGKVYFPRLIVPCATMLVALVDFAVSLAILFVMMGVFQFWPDWRILLLPAFVSLAVLAALGPALLMTAMNVKYRDFRFLIPFIVQFGLYVSPVGFSSTVVPEQWRLFYSLNPMVGVIDGFRWCLLGGEASIYWPGFGCSLAVTAALLWLGVAHFRKTERTFADLM